jgi:hypothetical protein
MFKKTLFGLLLSLLVACIGTPTPVPTPSAGQIDLEEQAVYAALLQGLYAASNYVIMDATATGPGGVGDTASSLARILLDMKGVDQATSDSFKLRNETSVPLKPNMTLGSGYVLLSQAGMNLIFSQNRDGWQLFYERYPNTPGITTISKVGFNGTLDQALVYVGTMSHYLAGAGYFVLLKKVNGSWSVDQQVMTWIS